MLEGIDWQQWKYGYFFNIIPPGAVPGLEEKPEISRKKGVSLVSAIERTGATDHYLPDEYYRRGGHGQYKSRRRLELHDSGERHVLDNSVERYYTLYNRWGGLDNPRQGENIDKKAA